MIGHISLTYAGPENIIQVLTLPDLAYIKTLFLLSLPNLRALPAFVNKLITSVLILLGSTTLLQAAEGGVSPYAYELTNILGLPITNAMVTTWVISLALIIGVKIWVGKPTLIPSKGQAVVESFIDSLRGLLEPIVGKHAFPMAFPLLIGIFLFILIHNWSALIPGVGAFGYVNDHGSLDYWFRPANADLNTTLGMALVAMIAWLFISIKSAGLKFFTWELFGNKADKKETPLPIYLALSVIFIGVGFIEVVSIIFRPVSLSFRLFGNVFGGENLLVGMTGIVPYIVPVPFYLYEVLVGVVQALIFTLLVAIYIGLITNHGDEDHAH